MNLGVGLTIFETTRHVGEHSKELMGRFTCEVCEASFVFKADLEWHIRCCGENESCVGQQGPDDDNSESFMNSLKLLKWEHAQTRAHSEEVDIILEKRVRMTRSSSVPPPSKNKMTPPSGDVSSHGFDISRNVSQRHGKKSTSTQPPSKGCLDSTDAVPAAGGTDEDRCRSHYPEQEHRCVEQKGPEIALKPTINDVQKRIHSLMQRMERILPATENSPDSQILSCEPSPASSSSDSVSLPDAETPSSTMLNEPESPASRAKSEPPQCTDISGASLFIQVARNDANGRGSGGHGSLGGQASRNGNESYKRRIEERGFDGDDNDGDPKRGLNPKRRKIEAASIHEDSKRFPCICHIGEPERFANDVAKHKHISNMW